MWPEPTVHPPTKDELIERLEEHSTVEATDGCMVEPDGICPHGHPSWPLKLGWI